MEEVKLVLDFLTMLGEWGIVYAIFTEARHALAQDRSVKLFEAIKYIESDEIRRARRTLFNHQAEIPNRDWDRSKTEPTVVDEAASDVCARYNLVGAVTQQDKELREFVVTEWKNNIEWTYESLQKYMKYREGSNTGKLGMYRHYAKLYEQAKAVPTPGVPK
jgi:hypothetical protein